MKTGALQILITSCLMLFTNCASNRTVTNKDFTEFPQIVQLNEKTYMHIPEDLERITVYKDSLLLVNNSSGSSGYNFSVYNLNTKQFVTNILKVSRAKGYSLGFMAYGIEGFNLWLYDVTKNTVIINNLDSLLLQKNYSAKSEYAVDSFYYGMAMYSPTEMLANGDYQGNNKVVKLNLFDKSVKKEIIQTYSLPNQPTSPYINNMYEGFLYINDDKRKCVSTCRYTDLIEINDFQTKVSKKTQGPVGFLPNMTKGQASFGEAALINKETREAFVSGKVTKKYIYLLYSGNYVMKGPVGCGKSIFVYDWDGRPIKKLELNEYAWDFYVTPNDEKIYLADRKNSELKIADL